MEKLLTRNYKMRQAGSVMVWQIPFRFWFASLKGICHGKKKEK
jgi:hypothetical protein